MPRVADGEAHLVGCSTGRRATTSPRSVNFSAFESRFRRICRTRCASVQSSSDASGTSATGAARRCRRGGSPPRRRTRARAGRMFTGARRTSSRPASAFARSRTSLMSESRCSPLRLMRSSDSRARGLRFSFGRRRQEVGEAEDRAERRAQLVAHRREELRLHLVRARRASPPAPRASRSSRAGGRGSRRCAGRPRAAARRRARSPRARRTSGLFRRRGAAPADLVADRDRLGEEPPQRHLGDAEVERRAASPPKSLVEEDAARAAPCTARGKPSAEQSMRGRATRPSAAMAWTGTMRFGAVEEVHDADVPCREAHEPAEPRRRQSAFDVERLQLPHELRVGARVGVARGERRVRARSSAASARARRGCSRRLASFSRRSVAIAPEAPARPRRARRAARAGAARAPGDRSPPSAVSSCAGGAGDVARDPDAAPERDDDREEEHAGRRLARRVGRLERALASAPCAASSASLRSSVADGAHLVGARLALRPSSRGRPASPPPSP